MEARPTTQTDISAVLGFCNLLHIRPLNAQTNMCIGTNGEACIGVLGIQDICHFTSRDIGYFPFYFQGYGILCSIFGLLSGILNILEN